MVALAGGQPIASFEGPQPPEQLRRWVDSLLSATAGKLAGGGAESPPADPALDDAREQLETGDFVGAGAAYRAILERDPNHEEAKGRCGRLTFCSEPRSSRRTPSRYPTPLRTISTRRSPPPTFRSSARTPPGPSRG